MSATRRALRGRAALRGSAALRGRRALRAAARARPSVSVVAGPARPLPPRAGSPSERSYGAGHREAAYREDLPTGSRRPTAEPSLPEPPAAPPVFRAAGGPRLRALRADLRRSRSGRRTARPLRARMSATRPCPTSIMRPSTAGRYAREPEQADHHPASTTGQSRADGRNTTPLMPKVTTNTPRTIRATPRASMTSTANTIRAMPRRARTASMIRATPPREEDQYDDEYEYADDEDGYADEEPKRRNLLKIALAGGARPRGVGHRRRIRLSRHVPWRRATGRRR